jgi:uncharacterized membrane protein YphA (DoxX/SURF4 family)
MPTENSSAIPTTRNRSIALLTLRLLLGFIFFLQGYGKVVTWGVENLYAMDFFGPAYKGVLPEALTHFTAYYTSYVELIGGALLILGLLRNYALYALASVLVIVTFGHGLVEPVWDLAHVFYRAVLLVALLLLPREWDPYALDKWLQKRKGA